MNRFTELTGLPATDFILEEAVNQSIEKEKLNQMIYENHLNFLTFEELSALELEYEKTSNKRNDSFKEARHTKESKKESRVREVSDSKNERKESQSRNQNKTTKQQSIISLKEAQQYLARISEKGEIRLKAREELSKQLLSSKEIEDYTDEIWKQHGKTNPNKKAI